MNPRDNPAGRSRVGAEQPLSAGMLVAWAIVGAIAIAAVPLTLSIQSAGRTKRR